MLGMESDRNRFAVCELGSFARWRSIPFVSSDLQNASFSMLRRSDHAEVSRCIFAARQRPTPPRGALEPALPPPGT